MSQCIQCGADLAEGSAFCNACGAAQESPSATGEPVASEAEGQRPEGAIQVKRFSTSKVAILAGVGLLVIGAATAGIVRFSKGDVRGTVVSLTQGRPVAGATITSAAGTAKTDSSGTFSVERLPIGTARVTVKVLGFQPFEATLKVESLAVTETTITIQDAALSGRLKELAAEPAAVSSATVQVARVATTLEPDGTFTVRGLPPGPVAVSVASPDHETTEATVTVHPGSNDTTVGLSLTPLETYRRFLVASQYHRDSVSYRYIHPDMRGRIRLSAWKKSEAGDEIKSYRFGTVRLLPAWKSPVTKKTYRDVAAIDRTIEGQYLGIPYTQNYTQCWAKVDGVWYILHKTTF
jgi:hypothetical protein